MREMTDSELEAWAVERALGKDVFIRRRRRLEAVAYGGGIALAIFLWLTGDTAAAYGAILGVVGVGIMGYRSAHRAWESREAWYRLALETRNVSYIISLASKATTGSRSPDHQEPGL